MDKGWWKGNCEGKVRVRVWIRVGRKAIVRVR